MYRVIASLLLFLLPLFGQEPVRIVTYNLLNYTTAARDAHFQVVMDELDADIVVVSEITSQSAVTNFRNNVLNHNGSFFSAGTFIQGPDTDNAIFYRTADFTFLGNTPIATSLRDINRFDLLHNAGNVTLTIFAVHLKAGTGPSNEQQRLNEVQILRNVTDNLPPGTEFIVCGDFNTYTSTEPAYQALLNQTGSGYVVDPLNRPGNWNNNISFADLHTQSTRVRAFGGGSTGGLDSRFDFLLTSQSVLDPGGVFYLTGTYTSFGNDGNHFNDSINHAPNTAVSMDVADGLHYASDHLPVYLDAVFGDGFDPPPAINAVSRSPRIPAAGENTTVTATIVDPGPLAITELRYTIDDGLPQSVTLDSIAGDTYSGDIPATAYEDGSRVSYWVYAEDTLSQSDESDPANFLAGTVPISGVHAVDGDGVLLYAGYELYAAGVSTLEKGILSSSTLNVYIQDETQGINLFQSNLSPSFEMIRGNSYSVIGTLAQANGEARIEPDDPIVDIIDNGAAPLPGAAVLTIAEFLANPEVYEGNLVRFQQVSPTGNGDPWPVSAGNAVLEISDDGGGNAINLHIDRDTDIDGTPEPSWPVDVRGVISQFDNSLPYNGDYEIIPRDLADIDVTVGLTLHEETPVIDHHHLYPNYPNPFNPSTVIRYQLSVVSEVALEVYNISGQRIRTLVTGRQPAGLHHVRWDGRDEGDRSAASGVYFAVLTVSGRRLQPVKLMLLK